jgi:hypothetical protein
MLSKLLSPNPLFFKNFSRVGVGGSQPASQPAARPSNGYTLHLTPSFLVALFARPLGVGVVPGLSLLLRRVLGREAFANGA